MLFPQSMLGGKEKPLIGFWQAVFSLANSLYP